MTPRNGKDADIQSVPRFLFAVRPNCITRTLSAAGLLAALSVPLLTGCAEPTTLCIERGGSTATGQWDTDAQRRAAAAIECDAHEITDRISAAAISQTDIIDLHNRTRELADVALESVRANGVESSRLPLSSAHQQMYAVAAQAESASGSPVLSAWAADPWAPLRPLQRAGDSGTGTLSTALMPGERRALAVNVRSTSASESKVWIQVDVRGLRPDAIKIYQVNWTGNTASDWVAAELELLGDASSTREASILPGVTRQIWIQLCPDVTTGAGRFQGNVLISMPGGDTTQVPVDIKLFNTRFTRPAMHFGGWDYSFAGSYAVRETNRSQLVEYLQSQYVDTPWAWRGNGVMHWKNLDADGNATGPPDSSALQGWLAEWPSARRFGVYLYVNDNIAGIPVTDSRFAYAVATWAQAWATEIRRLNKSPEQFDLLLVDEPQTEEAFTLTERWATAIRQSGAGFRIWTDLIAKEPPEMPQSVFDVVDSVAVYLGVAELNNAAVHESWARTFSERGKALELYAFDGPALRLDPSTYYRLTAWRAFFMGATALGFWSFTDNGGTPSDNEFANYDVNYSPLFVTDEVVRPGKHMEAAAEGIEDTQYLEMLKQVATTHGAASVRREAQHLLDRLALFVYRSPPSSNAEWRTTFSTTQRRSQHEPDGMDDFRIQVGEFLDSAAR